MINLTTGTTETISLVPSGCTSIPSSGYMSMQSSGYASASTIFPSSILTLTNNMNRVQNQYVVVFKIERNDQNEITSAKFIKEMWIETKNGSSVDFEVAKDSEISKYKADEISIRTIYTVTF